MCDAGKYPKALQGFFKNLYLSVSGFFRGPTHGLSPTTGMRIVDLGFRFFVFVCVSGYTVGFPCLCFPCCLAAYLPALQAKLTATLTLAEFKSSVSSIDDATARSWKICVSSPMVPALSELYPNAKSLLVPTEDFKEPGSVHAGDCQAFIG